MKRLLFPAMRGQNQKGIDVVDAIFAMIIASMIAAAVTTSLGTWFSIRTMTASQDGANQYAQGIIAKTSAVSWEKLGFVVPDSTPSPTSLTDDGSCPTAFRPSLKVGSSTLNTVTLTGANPAGLAQTDITVVRGQKYCVMTDVTWNNPADSSATSSKSYSTKNVSVKVSWKDKGIPHSITVNSTRSPNIGEAIPAGISQGHDAEVSPLKSFAITKADNDGTNGSICYKGDWGTTTDTVSVVGSTSVGLTPSAIKTQLAASDRNIEKCLTVNGTPSYFYYGLQVSDSAGVKFTGVPSYQFPGSVLTVSGVKLDWTSYPNSGTTKYRVMQSASADFSNPTFLTETTNSTFTVPSPSTRTWFRIDTSNSDYAVTATSNVAAVDPAPAPTPTTTPTPTASPTPVAGPSIASSADIVAYDANGELWNYGPVADASSTRKSIGAAGAAIPDDFYVTDWNSDGVQDLVIKKTNGDFIWRKGLPNGGFSDTTIGVGWSGYEITVGKWKKNDLYPSVIAKDLSTNILYNYPNPNGTGFGARVQVGSGWGPYTPLNLVDWDRNGNIDVLARNSSTNDMMLYRTDGAGAFLSESRPVIGTGWTFNSIHAISGRTGTGSVGLLARYSSGDLYYYPINTGTWGTRSFVSGGWAPYKIAGN